MKGFYTRNVYMHPGAYHVFSIETVDYWFRVSGGGAYKFNKTEGFFFFRGCFHGRRMTQRVKNALPVFFRLKQICFRAFIEV